MRLLRIPALFVVCLWLYAENGDDEFQPLAPAAPPLRSGQSYSWEQFREALLEPARQKLSFDDSPQP